MNTPPSNLGSNHSTMYKIAKNSRYSPQLLTHLSSHNLHCWCVLKLRHFILFKNGLSSSPDNLEHNGALLRYNLGDSTHERSHNDYLVLKTNRTHDSSRQNSSDMKQVRQRSVILHQKTTIRSDLTENK